jgi:polysaccharide chain length determinant protein (PEP-CTERM system associated)
MQPFELDKYKEIAIRRIWWIIIPLFLSIIAGISLSIKLPKIYRASTLILVQPQKVPESYIREIVSVNIEDRVRTITQQVTSRTNLEKIINDFNLYNNPRSFMFMEDKVEDLRRRITVDVSGSSRRQEANAFQIFFTGANPKQVADVANALASYFITENLKLREEQAMGTEEFLTEELANLRAKLIKKEEEIKEYREKYMGGLPEQLETNLRILESLQQQKIANQENQREAENRILSIQQQMSDAIERRKTLIAPADLGGQIAEPTSLDQLKAQLASLEARYTPRHPDIIRLKQRISELESAEQTGVKADRGSPKEASKSQAETNLTNQLREIGFAIENLKAEALQIESQIKWYQAKVEETPRREQELMSLNRDYDNVQETYNSLLSRKLEAELAVNMEKKQKGEQFRILDTAKIPQRPFKPDIQRLLLMSIALGFGLGFALAYLMESLDTSFRRPEEIENALNMTIIASLPFIRNAQEMGRLKRKKMMTAFSIGITVLFLGLAMIIYLKGIVVLEFFRKTAAFITG